MQNINVGTTPDNGAGEKLRNAMIIINDNFSELSGNFSNYTPLTDLDELANNVAIQIAELNEQIGNIPPPEVPTLQQVVMKGNEVESNNGNSKLGIYLTDDYGQFLFNSRSADGANVSNMELFTGSVFINSKTLYENASMQLGNGMLVISTGSNERNQDRKVVQFETPAPISNSKIYFPQPAVDGNYTIATEESVGDLVATKANLTDNNFVGNQNVNGRIVSDSSIMSDNGTSSIGFNYFSATEPAIFMDGGYVLAKAPNYGVLFNAPTGEKVVFRTGGADSTQMELDAGNLKLNGSLTSQNGIGILTKIDSTGLTAIDSTVGTTGILKLNKNGLTFNGLSNIGANTVFGHDALIGGTGSFNTAFGVRSLFSNTSGQANVAFGGNSLGSNLSGGYGVAVGYNALGANTTGRYNVAVGYNALSSNISGEWNTAIGMDAGRFQTVGVYNVAIGYQAMRATTEGVRNTSVGVSALATNILGGSNVAVGMGAAQFSTSLNGATIIGQAAGNQLTISELNTFVGRNAGANITTGSTNLIVAAGNFVAEGSGIITGNNNTIVGTVRGIGDVSNNVVIADGLGNIAMRKDASGVVSFPTSIASDEIIMKSPNGTSWSLKMTDVGGLVANQL